MERTLKDIAEIGYDGVELFVRDPDLLDVTALNHLLEQTGLEVCCVGTAPLSAQDKLTMTDSDPQRRSSSITAAKKLIDFTSLYGSIPVGIGKFRGNLPPNDRAIGWKWLRDGFLELCEYAEKKNVLIAVEPQGMTSVNNLISTHDCVVWIEQFGIPNLGLLLDTFNLSGENEPLIANIVEATGHISHVHVADSSRLPPGQGAIDFVTVVRSLRATGYNGFLSAEIAQPQDARGAAQKTWSYLNNILKLYA
ncbi:hypothetical protein FACS1894187_12640 [Synergistales bacterium]|nr:hypothetical protein FACS1894187_12640 [Synergistales bacterium]